MNQNLNVDKNKNQRKKKLMDNETHKKEVNWTFFLKLDSFYI